MKKPIAMLAVAVSASFGLLSTPALAEKTDQQNKMVACNKEAGDKKGDDRKAFMKQCLSAKKATQQDKMKTCNKDAGDKKLKGDDRKKFMSECLKA